MLIRLGAIVTSVAPALVSSLRFESYFWFANSYDTLIEVTLVSRFNVVDFFEYFISGVDPCMS